MSSNDESTIAQPELRYQLRNNTQPFESIFLNSWSSQRYHQTSITPLSSSTTPTKNSGSGYITSMVHQNPFGRVNQWGTIVVTLAFIPSLYIPQQTVTSTPMWRIPKLQDRLECEYEVKVVEEQRVGTRSLAHNTLGVKGHAEAPGWD
jgi:hypothetical protein